MHLILIPLFYVVLTALKFFKWSLIIYILMQWLINFQVINLYNAFVQGVYTFLANLWEPFLRRVRMILPINTVIDFAPFIIILVFYFIEMLLTLLMMQVPAMSTV